MKTNLIAATALAAVLTTGTAAATLSIDGGTAGITPSGGDLNDVLGSGVTWDGYYGGNVTLDSAKTLRFTFVGFEAGYVNTFDIGGQTFVNQTASPGDYFDVEVGSGVIPFSFTVNSGADSVANGANNPDTDTDTVPNFFLSFNDTTDTDNATSESALWVFLDDAGAGDDDNHDDLVVKISEVPEPGMLALLGAGLLGAGVVGRRRRS